MGDKEKSELSTSNSNSGLFKKRVAVDVPDIISQKTDSEVSTDEILSNSSTEKIEQVEQKINSSESTPPEASELSTQIDSDIPEFSGAEPMRYEVPQSPPEYNEEKSISENVNEVAGITTSQFILNNLKHGTPEIGAYLTEVDPDIVHSAKVPDKIKTNILNQVEKKNKDVKKLFEIPDWHITNIEEPLKQVMVEQGWETKIPPVFMLIFGGALLVIWFYSTQAKINKANTYYIRELKKIIKEQEVLAHPTPKMEVVKQSEPEPEPEPKKEEDKIEA